VTTTIDADKSANEGGADVSLAGTVPPAPPPGPPAHDAGTAGAASERRRITEDGRAREAKKAPTAEKTLRDARRLERLAAREGRDRLRRTARVESTTGGCFHFLPNIGLGRQIWQPEGLSGRKWRQGPAVPRPAASASCLTTAAFAMLREGLTGPSPPEEQHR